MVPSVEIWKECLRVLKPGGTMLCFAGSRTQHRMAVNVEDAGFLIKDCLMWLYGSGFPKATDISKQLDKMAGAEREVVGKIKCPGMAKTNVEQGAQGRNIYEFNKVSDTPSTPEAQLWNGYKSHGLKPAYEPIISARKPFNKNDYDAIIEANLYIEGLLWQLLARLEKTDMSSSQEMASIVWNIAALWNNFLNANLNQQSRYTISTETDLITELKTLKYLIFENTQALDTLEKLKAHGLRLSAIIAESSTKSVEKSIKDILNRIVQEDATLTPKENGIFANIAPQHLLQIIQNVFSVLQSAITTAQSQLTPNYEPIIMAMKRNEGSYAENALKHGVAGINIDAGRVGTETIKHSHDNTSHQKWKEQDGRKTKIIEKGIPTYHQGRFPSNLILDEEAAELLDQQTGVLKGDSINRKPRTSGKPLSTFNLGSDYLFPECTRADSGGASRFFKNIPIDEQCSLCYNLVSDKPLTRKVCQNNVNSVEKNLNHENIQKEREKTTNNDFVADNVQENGLLNNEDKRQAENKSVLSVKESFTNTQVTKENIVQKNAMPIASEQLVQNVKSAGNLCEKCATSIALSLVALQQGQEQELHLGQDSIKGHKEQILMRCLVSFVEMRGNTDTTPTTENLNLLFGCAYHAIENYMEQKSERMAKKQCQMRFSYNAKASKAERNKGCEGLEDKYVAWSNQAKAELARGNTEFRNKDETTAKHNKVQGLKNSHPCVKPLSLMKYLINLIMPPKDGLILDPFAGSGTTILAAKELDYNAIGIEKDEEYCKIARARLDAVTLPEKDLFEVKTS